MGIPATDRVDALLGGLHRNRRAIVSPEGVPLDIRIASHGERLTAFALDMLFMLATVIGLYILLGLLFFANIGTAVGMTVILFLAFIVRNMYFLHFELAWQGRTPGKRICNLRVISRDGGELSPSAVIARNLTREVEVFLPLSLYFGLEASGSFWVQLTLLGWATAITAVPLFNREHLRAGDIIGGTQVISMPKRLLLADLSEDRAPAMRVQPSAWTYDADAAIAAGNAPAVSGRAEKSALKDGRYVFSPRHLAIYGAFELQVLEEFLRRPATLDTNLLLRQVCGKICRKIGWEGKVPPEDTRRFLTDFYTAERAELERGQLFGKLREDKTSGKAETAEGGEAAPGTGISPADERERGRD